MIERVATNLLGETVEVRSAPSYPDYGDFLMGRGIVRAVFTGDRGSLCVLIENTSTGTADPPIGVLRTYDVNYNPIRVVRQCGVCGGWDHPSKLIRETPDPDWCEHPPCRSSREAAEKDAIP